jgi:hypothetical protein
MEPEQPSASPPPAVARTSRVRRLAMNAIAFVILYGNAAVALQPPQVRNQSVHLPCPLFLLDAFLITGMFNSYSLANTDMYLAGFRAQDGPAEERGRWVELDLREHFAQRQGMIFTQLFAAHEWDMHGLSGQRRAWVSLARRIREHHNRLHPERTITRVEFGTVLWPQSPLSYRALKRAGLMQPQPWYIEPEAP